MYSKPLATLRKSAPDRRSDSSMNSDQDGDRVSSSCCEFRFVVIIIISITIISIIVILIISILTTTIIIIIIIIIVIIIIIMRPTEMWPSLDVHMVSAERARVGAAALLSLPGPGLRPISLLRLSLLRLLDSSFPGNSLCALMSRHRLNRYLAQWVPSLFLAGSSRTCLNHAVLRCKFPWRTRYPLS